MPGSFVALMAVVATLITCFAASHLNFYDFSRDAKGEAALRRRNVWELPIDLLTFRMVAGVTTIPAWHVYGEVLLHPDQISAHFDSWFLALLAAAIFAVAPLGLNVVANFISAAADFFNTMPKHSSLKDAGFIAAAIALILYPFAPWETNATHFVNFIGSTMGPIFGIMVVDYYMIREGVISVAALYAEHGECRFQNGWHNMAFVALVIGMIF